MLKNICLRKTLTVAFLAFAAGNSAAQKILIDTDLNNLITFDIGTKQVDFVSTIHDINNVISTTNYITDVAFDPTGNLYGITRESLYTINQASGLATVVGSLLPGINGPITFTSLVFAPDGTLYAATRVPVSGPSGALYSVNTGSGLASALQPDPTMPVQDPNCLAQQHSSTCAFTPTLPPFFSSGDLAYVGNTLYLSGVTGATTPDQLITLGDKTSSSPGTVIGPAHSLGVANVWGLATVSGSLYAGANDQIYSVSLDGTMTSLKTFAGYGNANGASYYSLDSLAAVPEPGTNAMLLAGLGVMGLLARRRLPNVAG